MTIEVLDTAHRAASSTARELASWLPPYASADADLLPEHGALVARARDLGRNHGVAAGSIQTMVDNIVGTGFTLNARPDYRALGKTKEWADEWALDIEAKWRGWAETLDYDAARKQTFHGQTQLVCRTQFVQGEALALPLWLPERGAKYATCVQLVDPDRLSNPANSRNEERLRAGIRSDQWGAPISYFVRKTHPHDVGTLNFGFGLPSEWEEIPAYTPFRRPRVIHVHDMARTGQSRGVPGMTAVMPTFKMVDHYERAELQAAVVNAMIAAVQESALPMESILGLFGGSAEDYLALRKEHQVQLKPGAVLNMFPGDKLNAFMPQRPNDQFGEFTEHLQRHIGASIGLPLELLMKDFSKTNYSSARASLLEAWRFFTCRRDALITYWCDPVYALWLEEAANEGLIEATDFYENKAAWSKCEWIPDGRGWIDPLKEAQASREKRTAGVSTLARECAEQGLDWREVAEQQATEEAFIRKVRKAAGLEEVPAVAAEAPKAPAQEPEEEPAAA